MSPNVPKCFPSCHEPSDSHNVMACQTVAKMFVCCERTALFGSVLTTLSAQSMEVTYGRSISRCPKTITQLFILLSRRESLSHLLVSVTGPSIGYRPLGTQSELVLSRGEQSEGDNIFKPLSNSGESKIRGLGVQ